jgi:hypothetical protein
METRMPEAIQTRHFVLIWLPEGHEPSEKDWAKGERWHELGKLVVYAREAQPARPDGKVPWVRWEKTKVFAPKDIVAVYPFAKAGSLGAQQISD